MKNCPTENELSEDQISQLLEEIKAKGMWGISAAEVTKINRRLKIATGDFISLVRKGVIRTTRTGRYLCPDN